MSRAQLKHVLLDVDFFTNPKIRAMQRRYNVFATLGLIEVYMAMSMATNAVIDNDALLAIFEDQGADDPQGLIDYLLSNGLIIKELNGFSNSRVIKDQESLFKSQQRYKKHKEQTDDKRCENVFETLPLSDQKSEHLNNELLNIDNKNSTPSGLIKLSEHVRISPIAIDAFEKRIKDEGLDEKAKQEIIEALDRDFHKNPEKQRESCHFRDLISWPLREIRKDRAQLAKKDPFKPPEPSISESIRAAKAAEQNQKL